jgi:hypothetical protein
MQIKSHKTVGTVKGKDNLDNTHPFTSYIVPIIYTCEIDEFVRGIALMA